MKFLRFLISKSFFINLAIILALAVILFFAMFKFLDIYTHKGESLTVPDFHGFTLEQVKDKCTEKGLRYEVKDSVFKAGVPYFTILDQMPKPMSKVKENRTIYLTIASDRPPKVKLPNIIDVSLRRATKMIQTSGLEIGELEYIPHFATNLVLKVKKDGREIRPGSKIKKGSKVNLVLGDGLSARKETVPNLIGVSYEDVMFYLAGRGFNIGAPIFHPFDPSNDDSAKAIIYRQDPLPDPNRKEALGQSINIWLTTETIFKEMNIDIDENLLDSLERVKLLEENSSEENNVQ